MRCQAKLVIDIYDLKSYITFIANEAAPARRKQMNTTQVRNQFQKHLERITAASGRDIDVIDGDSHVSESRYVEANDWDNDTVYKIRFSNHSNPCGQDADVLETGEEGDWMEALFVTLHKLGLVADAKLEAQAKKHENKSGLNPRIHNEYIQERRRVDFAATQKTMEEYYASI